MRDASRSMRSAYPSTSLPWPIRSRISAAYPISAETGLPTSCATPAASRPMPASCSLRARSSRASRSFWLAASSASIWERVRPRSSRRRWASRFTAAPTRPTASPPSGSRPGPCCSAPTASSAPSIRSSLRPMPRSSSQTAMRTRSATNSPSVASRRRESVPSCSRTGRRSCPSWIAPPGTSSQSTSSSPTRSLRAVQGRSNFLTPGASGQFPPEHRCRTSVRRARASAIARP